MSVQALEMWPPLIFQRRQLLFPDPEIFVFSGRMPIVVLNNRKSPQTDKYGWHLAFGGIERLKRGMQNTRNIVCSQLRVGHMCFSVLPLDEQN